MKRILRWIERIDSNLDKKWNIFYNNNPDGGPWDDNPNNHIVNFIEKYKFKKGLKVLDCGCADGRNSIYLINYGLDLTGIDFSEVVIERTQKRYPTGKFVVDDIRSLSLEKNSFDIVIDAGALHVNDPKDCEKILNEYYMVLKKSGKMFIRIFNRLIDSDIPIFHVTPDNTMPVFGYSKPKFSSMVEKYFDIEEIIFDPYYGSHGLGCHYYYLNKKN